MRILIILKEFLLPGGPGGPRTTVAAISSSYSFSFPCPKSFNHSKNRKFIRFEQKKTQDHMRHFISRHVNLQKKIMKKH